ncbi:hypothetical protein GIB67_005729 [Kingdonia uniflora]|uniref:Peptidase A1 domain-containing protein n=1 Tax=Kingdonia uniflora TaxID=39325 RepID=A0A7J7KVI0_9MAGN|nr:hypothetical protein GIB67_005729 [Kingdonia uniflora]
MPASPYARLLILLLIFTSIALVCCNFPSILTLERSFPPNQLFELGALRDRDQARHSRLLQSSTGVVDFPVEGSSNPYKVGLYFTRVKLGSPPREFYVQIDTGSDILWVTCSSCNGCPKSSSLGIDLEFFDPGSSSSAFLVSCSDNVCNSAMKTAEASCSSENSQCSYSFQYRDGSATSGYFVLDLLNFDAVVGDSGTANSSAPIIFGCSNYQSGDLTNSMRAVDGIFGFGQHDLSVISQLSSRGIAPKVFSHCLKGKDNGGGILVLGLTAHLIAFFLQIFRPHYNLNLLSIAVNGQILSIDPAVFTTSKNRGTIVDSGTTLTYLAEEAYDSLFSVLIASVSQSAQPYVSRGNQCFAIYTSVNELFPLVTLTFAGGASMNLRPEEYLISYDYVNGAAEWCIGFQKVEGQGITILGDLVLKDKIVVYDLARQRLGWADYDCSSSVNVSLSSSRDEFINAQLSISLSPQDALYKLICIEAVAILVHIFLFSGYIFL